MRGLTAFLGHLTQRKRPALTESQSMQIGAAAACVFVSAYIGYAYAANVHLRTVGGYCWQLWTWAFCVAAVVAALVPWGSRPQIARGQLLPPLLLALAALLPRVLLLGAFGLHTDESGAADFALRHVFPTGETTINPFVTGVCAHPTLYFYLVRLSLLVFGPGIAGLRLSSAIGGALAVLVTYLAVATFQTRRTALLAAAVMAASHYHIHWSRIGLNNVWDRFWVPLILAAYAWGWKRRWSGGAVLAGLGLGLSQYFYPGARVGIFLLAWVAWDLWRKERDTRRLVVYGGKLLAVAACVAMPLAVYALRQPAVFLARAREAYGWSRAAIVAAVGPSANPWGYLWHQVWRSAGAYTAVPDTSGFYRPDIPYVNGLAAPLFAIGLLVAARKRQFLPVIWIALATVLGSIVLGGAPSSSHMVVSIPAICWLVATPIDWLFGTGRRGWAYTALALVVFADLAFYFGLYLPHPTGDLVHPFPPGPFH